MISIEEAIEESKRMENVSNGGSECFDFGDVVLVKYADSLESFRKGKEHYREVEEELMNVINQKRDQGVQIPRHFAVKRVIDEKEDIYYVLQEKAKGKNCAEISGNQSVSLSERYKSLFSILQIPFEQYKKLVQDGCQLYELGYEKKNKNLFYDPETGFWFIDFLQNDKWNMFDENDIYKVFSAFHAVVPNPIQMAKPVSYDLEKTEEEKKKEQLLKNSINAKFLLAIKAVIPNFDRYEKFYLLEESDSYKEYLMMEGIVQKDLLNLVEEDYEVYEELYEIAFQKVLERIIEKGEPYWSIECNAIRNESDVFHLRRFWQSHKENPLNRENYKSDIHFRYASDDLYTEKMLNRIVEHIKQLEPNDNIQKFLEDWKEKNSTMSSQK